MKSVFNAADKSELVDRINKLTPATQGQWGKMTVAQMLAHCNVTYEMIYDNIHKKPNPVLRFFLKMFVKNVVVSEKPYKKGERTGPAFLVTNDKNFDAEKNRLINYLNKTQESGEKYFDGKESLSFGKLTVPEWNMMMYKHLDHHLTQFGV